MKRWQKFHMALNDNRKLVTAFYFVGTPGIAYLCATALAPTDIYSILLIEGSVVVASIGLLLFAYKGKLVSQ